jgi:hypothetical protein
MRTLDEIRADISKQPDVAEVLGLVADSDQPGRFLFYIRTPFLTFPRFVIGSTDEQLHTVLLHVKTGLEVTALRHWELIQEGNR